MYARVAAFENRDMSGLDGLIQAVRDREDGGKTFPDALGMYMLVDRPSGTMLGISIFESEDAIRAAEPMFERMGDEIPEELRGKRLAVDTFEVAIHEVADDPVAARVSTFVGDPSAVDKALRHAVEEVLPEARKMDGWKGIMVLVDRRTGAERTITLWESIKALGASEAQAEEFRNAIAETAKQRLMTVERFEVPLAFDRAPRLIAV